MSIFYIAVHTLVINDENKILVTRRSLKNDYMPHFWDIPGGTVEIGETVEEALIRELKEETSLKIKPLQPIYAYTNLSQLPNRQTVQIVYTSKYEGGSIKLNPLEHDDYEWVDYSEIKNFKCIAFLDELIKKIPTI